MIIRSFCGLVFGAAVLSSCGTLSNHISWHNPKQTYELEYCDDLHVDISFTPTERTIIQEAAQEWLVMSGERLKINVIFDAEPDSYFPGQYFLLRRSYNDQDITNAEKHFDAKVIYGFYDGRGTIFIAADRINSQSIFRAVITHEMGHMIGMEHISGGKAIMNATVNDSIPCLTYFDAKQFAIRFGYDLDTLNYCTIQ